ncbi:MAG: hypothetical protein IKX00_04635 [Bacilli bacterium]|nr:hypothetical protein [Bacilli bacterium]
MKKKSLLLIMIFSFFFMKNNVFAETKTCKYSLSNVMRNVVSFDDYGKASFASGSSQLTDTKDQNLVMTITDPVNEVNSLTTNVTFSIEGSKFSIDKVTGGYNVTGPFDIYNYTVNGSKKSAIEKLKECPQLGILYNETSSDKYKITNITLNTAGSNIDSLVSKSYTVSANSCYKTGKLMCYYGDEENNYHGDKLAINYEVIAKSGTMGLYKMIATAFEVVPYINSEQVNSNIRIQDFKCKNGGYCCTSKTYYTYNDVKDTVMPITYEVHTAFETRSIPLYRAYHIDGNIYFSAVSLYDKETNSGSSGNPNIPGTYGYCKLNPNSALCKQKYNEAADKPFTFCDDSAVLKTLKIIHIIITIAKILVPILLIIYGSIDYGKAAFADNQDAIEKTTQLFIKKIIIGLVIFLIPTIINSIISFAQSDKDRTASNGDFKKCALCFAGDDACDYYIKNSK